MAAKWLSSEVCACSHVVSDTATELDAGVMT